MTLLQNELLVQDSVDEVEDASIRVLVWSHLVVTDWVSIVALQKRARRAMTEEASLVSWRCEVEASEIGRVGCDNLMIMERVMRPGKKDLMEDL